VVAAVGLGICSVKRVIPGDFVFEQDLALKRLLARNLLGVLREDDVESRHDLRNEERPARSWSDFSRTGQGRVFIFFL